MPNHQYEKVKVNEVEVDFVALKLLINNQWQDIEARQLNLLKLLIDNHGHAVSRNQIMDSIWQDTVVSDNSVSQAITQLRRSLHDDKETPRFIKTVPRVGYQLIADIEFPEIAEPIRQQLKRQKNSYIYIAALSAFVTVSLTLLVFKLNQPSLQVPSYQYESRLTSTPGPESFLRYSPNGQYLAFSQISEDRRHMDLAVYDAHTQSVHTIKNTGYSEEAPEWSPDGNWLVYFRHDPISCEIRIMSVKNPIETWRINPDRYFHDCQPGYSRQKLHWLNNNTLYFQEWLNDKSTLQKLSIVFENAKPVISEQQQVGEFAPVIFDIDKSTEQMLLVEKNNQQYQLSLVDLSNFNQQIIEQREQEYWGIKWHESGHSFWLGNESLRLKSLDGQQETVHLPIGFIPDLDLNPVTKQLAHAEGLINVNLYTLKLKQFSPVNLQQAKRLSSAARTDILPTVSNDGIQTAFVSYQGRSTDGLRHAEIWLKNKYKKTASLLVNLPENIKPQYLLWSPNGENLVLGDSLFNIYLLNVFSKHMVPILSNHQVIDAVNWSSDGKYLSYATINDQQKQRWQYDLQLASSSLIEQEDEQNNSNAQETLFQIKKLNPSYHNYLPKLAQFLHATLAEQLPVDNLLPSFAIYRPFVFPQGIYYVIKQGHQLTLYLYQFSNQENIEIAPLGNHEQDIHLPLNISASADGKELVFSKLEDLETDILVQRKVNN